MYREWSVSHVPRPYRAAASQALEAAGARRLRNESFISAPQLKRDPLGCATRVNDETVFQNHTVGGSSSARASVGRVSLPAQRKGNEGLVRASAAPGGDFSASVHPAFSPPIITKGRWRGARAPVQGRHSANMIGAQPNMRLKLTAPSLGRIPFVLQHTSCAFVNLAPPAVSGAAA